MFFLIVCLWNINRASHIFTVYCQMNIYIFVQVKDAEEGKIHVVDRDHISAMKSTSINGSTMVAR